jgi:hypothetical protein
MDSPGAVVPLLVVSEEGGRVHEIQTFAHYVGTYAHSSIAPKFRPAVIFSPKKLVFTLRYHILDLLYD